MTKRSFSDTNDEILYLKDKIKELEEKLALSEPKLIKNPIQQNNFVHNSLESGRIIHNLAYESTLQEYSGFYDFRTLNNFNFKNIYNNRLTNDVAINKKKEIVINYYKQHKKLINFGNIKLVIILDNTDENNNTFWIIDGQHRIKLFIELNNNTVDIPSTVPILVNVSVKLVNNEAEMNDYLQLYQQQYQPDLRLFSTTLIERNIKDFLIEKFRNKYKKAFNRFDNHIANNFNKTTHNYEQNGYISDGLVADLYNKINVFNKIYIIQNPNVIEEINTYLITNKFKCKTNRRNIEDCGNCAYGLLYSSSYSENYYDNINDIFKPE
jgi:hypothetical protein